MTVTSTLICTLLPTEAKGTFRSPCIKIALKRNNVFTLGSDEFCPESAASLWIHEPSSEEKNEYGILVD
jgi:hypothetical protein